jgi:hypothetical protein
MTRDEIAEKIRQRRTEAMKAGPIHRRDLIKNILRLQRELRDYDRFQAEARRCG